MDAANPFQNNKMVIKKRRWVLQLYQEFEHICYLYRIKLKRPTIDLSTASSYWGSYDPTKRQINLNILLIEQHPWQTVLEILKHEMAHQIVYEHFQVDDSGHGHSFQKAADMIGLTPWGRRAGGSIQQPIEQHQIDHPYAEKVKKLLQLSKSHCNEHEALLAMQRARALCLKYGLDADSLEQGSRSEPSLQFSVLYPKRKRLERYHAVIASILQEHFLVDVIFSSSYDAEDFCSYKTIELFGSSSNVRIAVYVYHFILNQLPLLWQSYEQTHRVAKRHRLAYYMGILQGFENQLGEAQESKQPETDESVLSSAKSKTLPNTMQQRIDVYRKKLDDFLRKRHPRLQSRRWSHSGYDRSHYENGVRRGRELSLKTPISSQNETSSKPRLLPPTH